MKPETGELMERDYGGSVTVVQNIKHVLALFHNTTKPPD